MQTFASFLEHNSRLGRRARSYPAGARRNLMSLMLRVTVLTHKFRGDDQKKSSALNLRLRFGVHLCVLSWNETLLTLGGGGGTSCVLEAQAPKCTPVVPGQLLFVWGTILAWVGRFLAREGRSSDLGGTAPKCSPWHGA